MLVVDIAQFFSLLLALGVLAVFGLWMWMDARTTKLRREAPTHSYHCVRCGNLYSGPESATKIACPRCGFANISLKI